MGGSGGSVIVHSLRITLSDPLVHGQLPESIKTDLDPVLAKNTWTHLDKLIVSHAISWALLNCP